MDIKTRNVERVSSSFCDEVNKGLIGLHAKAKTTNGKPRLLHLLETASQDYNKWRNCTYIKR